LGALWHIWEHCGARVKEGMGECARLARGFVFPGRFKEAGLGRKWRVWAGLRAPGGWNASAEWDWVERANEAIDGMAFPFLF